MTTRNEQILLAIYRTFAETGQRLTREKASLATGFELSEVDAAFAELSARCPSRCM